MSCLECLVSCDGDYWDGDWGDGDWRDRRRGHHVDHERCGHPRRLLRLCPFGEYRIGQRDRHDDGDAGGHGDGERRLHHLLLLLWHIDLVWLLDPHYERGLWNEPDERIGGRDGTEPQHDLPLRARRI
jgi:hypothetical protein